MPHVTVEKIGYTVVVSADNNPVLETSIDLTDRVVIDFPELLMLLEEVSDEAVELIDLEE